MSQMDRFAELRAEMVADQLVRRGIQDENVLEAMQDVPRHMFVPDDLQSQAYSDQALTLGPGQSISQPYVVAVMLENLAIKAGDKVLDVGTGSGYQTAILIELGAEVYSIEIDAELGKRTEKTLHKLGYTQARLKIGDGKLGWPEHSPFDAIIVSAACEEIPRELVRQLANPGRMILPLGDEYQYLTLLTRSTEGLNAKEMGAVQFVRMK